MADLSSVTDNYFTIASETFTDNLSASIAALAVSVPVNNNSEYTNGDAVVLTVDPGTVNEATFIGEKSGLNFINCIWTEGNTGVGHSSGATIIDYDSATHHNAQTKGIKQFANDDGTLIAQPIRDALGLSAASTNGWEVFPYTMQVSSGYSQGNNSYELTVANQNITTLLSPGMRLRLERSTTAPTQCADLESSSSQYASKGSPTALGLNTTGSFEAWVNLESYSGTTNNIINTRNGSVAYSIFRTEVTGQLAIYVTNASASADTLISNQSIPLGRWVHVAGSLTVNTGGSLYINGISVPSTYTNGATTAFGNTGTLAVGTRADSPSEYFDGKLSDVRVWNTIRTQTEIRDNKDQQLTGSESGLVAYYKLNGDFNDSTSNANHLTASGGALATDLDNPMKNTQYAIVTKVDYSAPNSTITVFTGTDHIIPNMTLTSPFYSSQSVPFGFPRDSGRWTVETFKTIGNVVQSTPTINVWYNIGSLRLRVPVGAWKVSYATAIWANHGATASLSAFATLSTADNTQSDEKYTTATQHQGPTGNIVAATAAYAEAYEEITTPTTFHLNHAVGVSGVNAIRVGQGGPAIITAECAYL